MPEPLDILEVMQRVLRDPTQPMTTADLAAIAGWSPAHFHRHFTAIVGETPKRWSTRVKVASALLRMHGSDAPLHEIAIQSGFSSHAVFTRTVRRVTGLAPEAHRAQPTPSGLQHAPCLSVYHLSPTRRVPMSIEVQRVERAAQPVLYMRREVPPHELQQAMAQCLPAVFMHCQQHGITMVGPPFTRYVAMRPGMMTIEAGMPVQAGVEGSGEILAGELPGGPTATAIHAGAYDRLGETHSGVVQWASANGYTPAGAPWETYLTDPGEVPNPEDWRTEICLPLAE